VSREQCGLICESSFDSRRVAESQNVGAWLADSCLKYIRDRAMFIQKGEVR